MNLETIEKTFLSIGHSHQNLYQKRKLLIHLSWCMVCIKSTYTFLPNKCIMVAIPSGDEGDCRLRNKELMQSSLWLAT